jgi:FMN-dependent NADH-azoreductase
VKLLEIQSSPRGEFSDSITLTKSFIEACKSDNTSVIVDTLNVWHERLPEFDEEAIGAKYKAVKHETMTEAESHVWERIQSLIERFQNADRIVLRTPMWNFGLPYKLKQLIDLVAQRNYLFTYHSKQYGPLLHVEKAIAVYTRFTLPGGHSYTALAIRSPSNLLQLLVAACRCSGSSERDC